MHIQLLNKTKKGKLQANRFMLDGVSDEVPLRWCRFFWCIFSSHYTEHPLSKEQQTVQNVKVQHSNSCAKKGGYLQTLTTSSVPLCVSKSLCIPYYLCKVSVMWLSPDWLMCLAPQESEVRYFTAPMFTLHQINAFEDNGFLVMDMCCGDDGEVIGDFTLENLRRGPGEDMDKVNAVCLWIILLSYYNTNTLSKYDVMFHYFVIREQLRLLFWFLQNSRDSPFISYFWIWTN